MAEPKTLIYAELLSNIRQISVIVALHTPCTGTTKAELSADRHQLVLNHEGETTTLRLPGQVSSNSRLQRPVLGKKEISWRLPLAGQPSRADVESAQNVEAPWSAKNLREDAEFSCRDCNAVILKRGSIKTWKDLPSENWAEMMEFWHCHKPDDEGNGSSGHASHNHVEDHIADRGYGVNTKFLTTPGVGFVDITTFLLSNSDCTNIQSTWSSDTTATYLPVYCANCKGYLGRVDQQAEGIRIYKWRLQLTRPKTLPQAEKIAPPEQVLSSHISSLIYSQCTSRLLLLPPKRTLNTDSGQCSSLHLSHSASSGIPFSSSTSSWPCSFPISTLNLNKSMLSTGLKEGYTPFSFISLWVLTPSIRLSAMSSSRSSSSISELYLDKVVEGQLAMKLFWKVISAGEAALLMDKEGIEEVALPAEVIIELKDCLSKSAMFLPPSARMFQDWHVGLLERYEEE